MGNLSPERRRRAVYDHLVYDHGVSVQDPDLIRALLNDEIYIFHRDRFKVNGCTWSINKGFTDVKNRVRGE